MNYQMKHILINLYWVANSAKFHVDVANVVADHVQGQSHAQSHVQSQNQELKNKKYMYV